MSSNAATQTQDLIEKLRNDGLKSLKEREDEQQANRERLRDFVVQLREPGNPYTQAPANLSSPSFKIGDVANFPYPTEYRTETPGQGHLSDKANEKFMEHMRTAANSTDVRSRDNATESAAKVVAKDWLEGAGKENVKPSEQKGLLHELRAQVTFQAKELGEKLGLSEAGSSAVAFSLERALEKEGFKVLASHAVDKAGDVFKASTASVAAATGVRHNLEKGLNESLNWLAERGVSKETIKDTLKKHSGKITAVLALSENPEVVQKAAQVIAKSDGAIDAVVNLSKDEDLRKAVGTVAMAAGETAISVPGARGVGSVAIAAGSLLKGESTEETSRHVFRAALSIAGGAVGGAVGAAGGPLAVATAVVGAEVGNYVADKLLGAYDYFFGSDKPEKQEEKMVSKGELQESLKVIQDKGYESAASGVKGLVEKGKDEFDAQRTGVREAVGRDFSM